MRTNHNNTTGHPGFGPGAAFGPGRGRRPGSRDIEQGGDDRPRFRHGGFGPGPEGPGHRGGGGFGPGFGGPFGGRGGPFGGRGGRGPRARKGDIRITILSLLEDAPSNGYALIKAITEKTNGAWRPSPGSVYPTLAQLVDEGMIETGSGDSGGGSRSAYQLTDEGRTYVTEHADEIATAWAGATTGQNDAEPLFEAAGKLFGAVRQFATEASETQRTQAATKLDELRRELYRMLGE